MVHYNKKIGTYGEFLAQKYLEHLGYNTLERNFRYKYGEIDIISYIPCTNFICFIEVKSRFSTLYGYPREAITYKKTLKIKNTAKFYIIKNHLCKYNFRFDVIEILFKNNKYKLSHIKNAF